MYPVEVRRAVSTILTLALLRDPNEPEDSLPPLSSSSDGSGSGKRITLSTAWLVPRFPGCLLGSLPLELVHLICESTANEWYRSMDLGPEPVERRGAAE